MLLLQLEKGTEESGPGPSRLQIPNSEGCQNNVYKFMLQQGYTNHLKNS